MMGEQGQREEIDLTPAQPAPVPVEAVKPDVLPEPVCPQGVVIRELTDAVDEPEAAPGTSPIDDIVQNGGPVCALHIHQQARL
jgi:hypothetical protein